MTGVEELLFQNIKDSINSNLKKLKADLYKDLLNRKELIEYAKT